MVVLAQQTGGFARVLHSTDATFSESQRTKDDKSEDARRIEPTRRALGFICLRTRFNPCSRFFGHRKEMPPATKSVAMSDAMINIIRASQLWGVASCFAFLLSLLISLESPTFGGHTCGELAMLFPSWASSPVITFSLWRVLLIGLACALGLLASPSQLQRVYTAYAATYLGVYCILGAIALPLMQWEMFELSFLCLATQIFVLLSLYDLLAIGTHARGLFIEFFTDCVVSALIPWTVHILAQLGAAWTTRNQVVHVGWSYGAFVVSPPPPLHSFFFSLFILPAAAHLSFLTTHTLSLPGTLRVGDLGHHYPQLLCGDDADSTTRSGGRRCLRLDCWRQRNHLGARYANPTLG